MNNPSSLNDAGLGPIPRAPRVAAVGDTIFATMSALAASHNAANLGQGFPDEDGPEEMLRIAASHITGTDATPLNQYGPGRGLPALRQAITADRARRYGHEVDPDTEVIVTVGATEAMAATLLGLVPHGTRVLAFEPAYDAYPVAANLAGAELVGIPLSHREGRWSFDVDALSAAVTADTAAIILNTPHNPTGLVLSRADLDSIATVIAEAEARDAERRRELGLGPILVITDEVYERLVFTGEHIPFATLPGMAERTVTISSAAKTFNVTGWKIGWAMGPAHLITAVLAAKQYLSFVGATPFQPAVAWALDNAESWSEQWNRALDRRRQSLTTALSDAGLAVLPADGTYFVTTDIAPLGTGLSGAQWCERLPEACGLAAIPLSAFDTGAGAELDTLVRWTFCKDDATMARAVELLTPENLARITG